MICKRKHIPGLLTHTGSIAHWMVYFFYILIITFPQRIFHYFAPLHISVHLDRPSCIWDISTCIVIDILNFIFFFLWQNVFPFLSCIFPTFLFTLFIYSLLEFFDIPSDVRIGFSSVLKPAAIRRFSLISLFFLLLFNILSASLNESETSIASFLLTFEFGLATTSLWFIEVFVCGDSWYNAASILLLLALGCPALN